MRDEHIIVDVQFNPAATDWSLLLEATLAAEQAGFGAVWVFDHLAGTSLGGDGMLECFTLLGALAATTERILLGSLVTNVWNRSPGVVAVGAATVEHIADRQVLLGLGAGTSPTSRWAAEQHAVSASIKATVAERHARVEEVLDLLDAMWSPGRAGTFATFPLPRIRPLTLVGVNSVALAAIAGRRADGINTWWGHPLRDELLGAADDAGAAERRFVRTVYEWWDEALLDPDHRERVAMRERRIDRLVLADRGRPDPERIARHTP